MVTLDPKDPSLDAVAVLPHPKSKSPDRRMGNRKSKI
jgi:hypothetical protein